MSGEDVVSVIAYNLFIVLCLGIACMWMSRKGKISYIPLFIIIGLIFSDLLHVMNRDVARTLFNYVRVFGLVLILFAEGHDLKWPLLKKHFPTIGLLDTVSLVITAILAAFVFSWLFHAPLIVGFLFGAIISATDPATLIPLFHQYRVREDIRTVIVTESIFNDPLGIVLTSVAIALVLPQAPAAHQLEIFASHMGIYPGAVAYFLYEVVVSILIGAGIALLGYYIIKKARIEESPEIEIFSLALAFSGFFAGEYVGASGYLVATTIGIILGNHYYLFRETREEKERIERAIAREVHFNETLASFATIFIFVLLGASVKLGILISCFLLGAAVAFFVMLIARPVAATVILKWWKPKEYLFISLEGPRGVVPSALAGLPLALAITYHATWLVHWGEVILSVTIITVLLSVIVETLWVPTLRKKLLGEGGKRIAISGA